MIDWEPGEMQFHDSVDEFLDAVVAPDPDGSKRASRAIEDDLGLIPRPAWYEHVEGWSRSRRKWSCRNPITTQSSAPQRLHWLSNRNVVLFALAAVGFWLALWWAL